MKCKQCGQELALNEVVCNKCGASQEVEETANNESNIKTQHEGDNPRIGTPRIGVSITALILAFTLGELLPWLFTVVAIFALVLAIFSFRKIRSKTAGWSIALAGLALLLSILNITNVFYAKAYANETGDRIKEELNLEIPEGEQVYSFVTIANGQLIKRFSPMIHNEIRYQLSDASFEDIIKNNDNFKTEIVEDLRESYPTIVLENTDISLVHRTDYKYFGFLEEMAGEYKIIINYNFEEKVLQIIEIFEEG